MKVSLSPDVILCGWLGLKHQLNNSSVQGSASSVTFVHRYQRDASLAAQRNRWNVSMAAAQRNRCNASLDAYRDWYMVGGTAIVKMITIDHRKVAGNHRPSHKGKKKKKSIKFLHRLTKRGTSPRNLCHRLSLTHWHSTACKKANTGVQNVLFSISERERERGRRERERGGNGHREVKERVLTSLTHCSSWATPSGKRSL